ncbi:MAG: hypothetical protein Q7R35_03545 [Elusimicrobiota bacterium]|nr:hypothetical protein [Elusimicrobiota bacterium]
MKFPSGVNFAYSIPNGPMFPWPAGWVNSLDTPIIVPGLNEFIGSSLVSGIYYYLPELFASATASDPALFRKSPVAKGTLREITIYNPSVYRSNAAVAAVWVSSAALSGMPAAVTVKLKNFGNANMTGLALKLFSGEALVEEKLVDILPAQQEKEIEFAGTDFHVTEKGLQLRAVLVAEDDYPEDNYMSVEIPLSSRPLP